jgi:tubulin monoglycylase TTLL3/8
MENALLIAKRKFDLRQWVLVTDWNPLTVYFYNECYARLSVEEYSTAETSLNNSFVHLVNNSIGKNSDKFHDQIQAENGENIEGFMMSHEGFKDYIQHLAGDHLHIIMSN